MNLNNFFDEIQFENKQQQYTIINPIHTYMDYIRMGDDIQIISSGGGKYVKLNYSLFEKINETIIDLYKKIEKLEEEIKYIPAIGGSEYQKVQEHFNSLAYE